jgi:DNA polymerase III epsilon subunit
MDPIEAEFVVMDVETTGLFPTRGDRIIEIAGVKIKNGAVVDTMHSMINPERDIPEEARRIHNIDEEMLLTAPTSQELLPRFLDFIGGAGLIGHNIKFDMDFLCYQLSLIGRKLHDETPAIDTLKMAKMLMPHLSSFRLAAVANALGVKVGETHRALSDVSITVEVFNNLVIAAQGRNIHTFQDMFKHFSVPKPVFKIKQATQESLF